LKKSPPALVPQEPDELDDETEDNDVEEEEEDTYLKYGIVRE
jgi:hypothetical protein